MVLMHDKFTMYRIARNHLVFELDEDLTPKGLALELHVYRGFSGNTAFWQLENGELVGFADFGEA